MTGWRAKRYSRFYSIVDEVVNELQNHIWISEGRAKRRLSGNDLNAIRYSVEALIRDSISVVYQRRRYGPASIHKNKTAYTEEGRDPLIRYRIHIERAYLGLIELGYLIETDKGFHDRKGRKDGKLLSRLTRYQATDKLIQLFTAEEQCVLPAIIPPARDSNPIRVRVRDKETNRRQTLPTPDTANVRRMQSNLDRINDVLNRYWIDLEVADDVLNEEFHMLGSQEGRDVQIRMNQRSLYRVFNDPELKTGGRFYGGWWQNIPRGLRQHLLIDGKRTIELDYSNQHPTILYLKEGLAPLPDSYSGILGELEGHSKAAVRSMVKAAFNAMLNAGHRLRQAPEGIEPAKYGLKWRHISEAIEAFHQPIAKHFYTGIGLRLQRMDSDIAERVMLTFARHEDRIPILPLHDSFILHHGYEDMLRQAMENAFEELLGFKPKTALTKRHSVAQPDWLNMDMDAIIAANSNGHDQRLAGFRSLAG